MFDHATDRREYEVAERYPDMLPEIAIAIAPVDSPVAQPEARGFELPGRIWVAMIACYGLFLASMFAALGGSGKAAFGIAISLVYVTVFFAVARVLIAQNPGAKQSVLDRDGFLMTHFGPMDRKAVYGQILVVPLAVALFGLAVAIIIALSGAAI
ncbi:MAG: hypothetical protein JY451_09035 [Erythrobacter sp.]|nr:MAG: hypothetical protein JY451_09035 [Erythrobacter sp.]